MALRLGPQTGGFASGLLLAGQSEFPGSPTPGINGSVTFVMTPGATLALSRHYSIVTDLTIEMTPGAAALLYTQWTPSIQGDVTHSMVPGAAMAVTRHHAIAGDVQHAMVPGATMAYAADGAHGIVGQVTHTLTPGAAMDVTRHFGIAGSLGYVLTPGATMAYTDNPASGSGLTAEQDTLLREIHNRLGLEDGDPLVHTRNPDGSGSFVSSRVQIALTGDGVTTSVATRQ